VISACFAIRHPVTRCHPDSSCMVEMAQGKSALPREESPEVIRGMLFGAAGYWTDVESFARKGGRDSSGGGHPGAPG
jgi:hypothetical protein